jgi:hypothetical protein
MRKLLLSLGLLLGLSIPALAQVPCVGVGGVNTVPQVGVSCVTDSLQNTYGAVAVALAVGTAPTDVSCLSGATGKVIRVKRVRLSGTAGTAINIEAFLTKHASLDSGGTPATGTSLPVAYALDSANPTASATPTSWTVNPTINDGSPGYLGAATVFLPVTSTAASAPAANFYFDQGGPASEPPTLRTAAQQICVNLNAVTAPSTGLLDVEWIWTEAAQ